MSDIVCKIKFALWLLLFTAPILVALWGQRLDRAIAENVFTPAPDSQIAIVAADSSQF